MKTLLLLITLAVTTQAAAQCSKPWKRDSEPTVTAGVIIDYSLIGIHQFNGIGIHAGIWADWIGVFAGYVEYKMNDYVIKDVETETVVRDLAKRTTAVTIAGRYLFFDENIQVVPFFSVGFNNYQNIGISAAYKIDRGLYAGIGYSRTGHLSATMTISIEKK